MRGTLHARQPMALLVLGLSLRSCGGFQLLRLRGGSVAQAQRAAVANEVDDVPAAVQLQVIANANPEVGATPQIELGPASFAALQLKPGDRVRVRKMTKASLWSNVPDFAVGVVVEDAALDDGSVRMPPTDIRELRLKIGQEVLVAPVPAPPASEGKVSDGSTPSDEGVTERYRYRRRNGWMRTAMWMMYGGRPYGYGYGYGYAGGHKRTYGRRTYGRSYGGRRMSGGMRRRR